MQLGLSLALIRLKYGTGIPGGGSGPVGPTNPYFTNTGTTNQYYTDDAQANPLDTTGA